MNSILTSLKHLTALGFLAVLAYFGERGQDGGFIKDVWTAAKTASPFAAMFAIVLLLDERRERRQAQQQCQDRTISFVEASNATANALEQLIENLKDLGKVIKRGQGKRG